MFNSILSGSVTPSYHREKVYAVAGVPGIEISMISFNQRAQLFSNKVLYTLIQSLTWLSASFLSLGMGGFSIVEMKVSN